MPSHAFYIDDSGTKEYADDPTRYNALRGISRYFVFCGTLLSVAQAGQLSDRIISAKLRYFGVSNVELKSNWLRIPRERARRYLIPYGIDDATLDTFVGDIYRLIKQSDLMFIAAIIDKQHVQEDYPRREWYPPAIAYELLLQRVQSQLIPGQTAAIIIDDMTGATPVGNQYKRNLKLQHLKLLRYGSGLQPSMRFDRIAGQRFVDSALSHIVQISDLAAYNVHRQFNQYGLDWERAGGGPLAMYPYFREMCGKFRMDANGRVQGYGIVKFPLRQRVLWGLTR